VNRTPLTFACRTAVLGFAVWLGVYQGNAGAGNVLTGLAAIECAALLVLSFGLAGCDEKTFRRIVAKRGPVTKEVPAKLVALVDGMLLAVLVWFGWWVTAVLFAFGAFFARLARVALTTREGGAR
jgi:hypothetical protein